MNLTLERLPNTLAVCRLQPDAAIPDWAGGPFVSITRTAEELSIVCSQDAVPDGITAERDWRALRVAGTLDFALVGIIARLSEVLAAAEVSLFIVSTYDTDYVLVKAAVLAKAEAALTATGVSVRV